MSATPASVLDAFDRQVAWCTTGLAPFTARLLQRSRMWLASDGDALAAFTAVADDPLAAAVSLRWAAALHHLALRGMQPWAGLWPPSGAGVQADDAALDAAISTAWHKQQAPLRAALALPPQTNEVQRSAVLLPGLLHVAGRTGLPLSLLEVGASAGLNLWCDRYRYEHQHERGVWTWGGAAAALTLRCDWRGPLPVNADARLKVARRAGCDANPIDLSQPDEGLRLASFIWPEQAERLARLHTARREVARWLTQEVLAIEALPAAQFVARELHALRPGHATVLMHSVVWQYIAPAEQAAIRASIEAAGARATPHAPLAWLRMEPPQADLKMELRCRLWPGGEDRLLAVVHPHGAQVNWQAGA